MKENTEILLYQTEDGRTKVEVRLENETVWLTQSQMVELFQTTKQNISLHIRNIYEEGELQEVSTVKDYLTVQKIRDKGNPLRQLLDQCSGNRTIVLEKGQRLTSYDIEENLVVLFVMIQSISRTNGKEALKVFQDSGGYDSFFPADNRYDLHKQLLEHIPNLDFISPLGTEQPLIMTSLGNAIRVAKPFIIIDEIHKVFSENARKTIDTTYKKKVLDVMTEQKQLKNIKAYQTQIPFEEYVINDKVECYLIEQGKEVEKLKEILI